MWFAVQQSVYDSHSLDAQLFAAVSAFHASRVIGAALKIESFHGIDTQFTGRAKDFFGSELWHDDDDDEVITRRRCKRVGCVIIIIEFF